MKIEINKLKLNSNNPRLIKDFRFKKLVNSIKEFPEMLEKRPVVVDENYIILGGNMRYKACKELGLKEIYIIKADNLTDNQIEQFIIKDNVGFGEWDWDVLANSWDIELLNDWGLDLPISLNEEMEDISEQITTVNKIEVELESEVEQEKLYNELVNKGYKCRVLTF